MMRVSVVPAQVTTVEDRIIGCLGFMQILILVSAILCGAGVFVVLPPMMGEAWYKYGIIAAVLTVGSILSIRVRGVILAHWVSIIVRYNQRPMYYVADKNTTAYRQRDKDKDKDDQAHISAHASPRTVSRHQLVHLDASARAKARAVIDDPAAHIRIATDTKGGVHVRITQVN
jgi:hypothetical protein